MNKIQTSYPIIPIGFKRGQLHHILQYLPPNHPKRFTTAITTTNPETTQQTEHDNITLERYYDPEFDTKPFTITIQTYVLRFPMNKTGQIAPICQKNDLSTRWRSKSIIDDYDAITFPFVNNQKVVKKNNQNNNDSVNNEGMKNDIDESPSTTTPSQQHRRFLLREGHFPIIQRDEPLILGQDHQLDDLIATLPPILRDVFNKNDITIVPQTVTFTYGYFSYEEIMAALLPENLVIPTGFSPTGHIAHFNLREDILPYQYIAGRVLCDKTTGIKTVINKVGMINNVFRNFQAEILYGIDDFVTEIRENGYNFVLDFSQVYWNSRLLTEHSRLTKFIHGFWKAGNDGYNNNNKKNNNTNIVTDNTNGNNIINITDKTNTSNNDNNNNNNNKSQASESSSNMNQKEHPTYALDLFGGIGPFVIPLIKPYGPLSFQHQGFGYHKDNMNRCVVWGNDINPKSSLYMWKNIVKNRLVLTPAQIQRDNKRAMIVAKNKKGGDSGKVDGKDSNNHSNNNDNNNKKKLELKQLNQNDHDNIPNAQVFNSCGRELMTLIAKQQMAGVILKKFYQNNQENISAIKQYKQLPFFQHAIMNLPASAVEFLDMYVGLYTDKSMKFIPEIETLPPISVNNDDINNNQKKSSPSDQNTNLSNTTTQSTPNKIVYLTSQSKLNDIDTNSNLFVDSLIKSTMLPPHFDPTYEKLVQDMPITDERHHWSNLQQIRLNTDDIIDENVAIGKNDCKMVNNNDDNNLAQGNNNMIKKGHTPTLSINNTFTPSNTLYIPSIVDIKTNIMKTNRDKLIVHCHCFVRDEIDPYGEALNLVEGYLGFQLPIMKQKYTSNIDNNDKNTFLGLKINYDNQLPIIDSTNSTLLSTNITQHFEQNNDVIPNTSFSNHILDIHTRQQSYINAPEYTNWKSSLNISPTIFNPNNNTDVVVSNENLLLMEYCISQDGVYVHHVRNVAPGKDMMCVSFVVPDFVLFYSKNYYSYLQNLLNNENRAQNGIKSEYDNTNIDQVDIDLFNQQTTCNNNITLTRFLFRKVQSINGNVVIDTDDVNIDKRKTIRDDNHNCDDDNNDHNNNDNNKELANDNTLSKLPNDKTRGRTTTPPLQPNESNHNNESPIIQPIKKTKL